MHSGREAKCASIARGCVWRWLRAVAAVVALGLLPAAARAADDPPEEHRQLIDAGLVDQLEARLPAARTPEHLRQLARAAANRALRAAAADRQSAFEDAERRHNLWLTAVKAGPQPDSPAHRIAVATVLGEMGGLLLSKWATPDLDEFEISSGLRFERERLSGLLERAREYYEQATQAIADLVAEAQGGDAATEDRLLAEGVFDALLMLNLELTFNLGYANLYIGLIDAQPERRSAALRNAEHCFRSLLDAGPAGVTIYRVNVGLGITLREQRRFDDAQRAFAAALEGSSFPAEAHVRYEQARAWLRAGKFDDARVALRPLLDRDPEALAGDDRPARFYLNLARLLDAYGYLLESEELRRTGAGPVSVGRAQRAREAGLIRMNRLAARGGPWPGVVQVYVAANIRADERPADLSPIELLFTARQLSSEKRYLEAIERLEEGRRRTEVGRDLAGEILFELAVCYFRRDDARRAAALFDELATTQRQHDKAREALGYSYQLWSRIASESGEPADYGKLADTLANLLANYPGHERRHDAQWWLPLALQSARRYEEAAELFDKLPRESVRWEEAQFRRVVCLRQELEARRAGRSSTEFAAAAERVIAELRRYGQEAQRRAGDSRQPVTVRNWAAQATLHAAELLLAPECGRFEEALRELDQPRRFEERFPDADLQGRVLAARIRAYRGLRQFDAAAAAVEQFVKAAGPAEAAVVLTNLAAGMHAEIERLEADGRLDEARALAASALPLFTRLDVWGQGGAPADALTFAAARVHQLAGRLDEARKLAERLIAGETANGAYLRLHAQILTEALALDAPAAQPEAGGAAEARKRALVEARAVARRAWERLLADASLKQRAPSRYWEARCQQLALLLEEGAAEEVERAIRNERAWDEELGGPPWRERLEELYQRAGGTSAPTGAGAPGG